MPTLDVQSWASKPGLTFSRSFVFVQYTRPRLDAKFSLKFHYAKRRILVTSKYRHMHGVLNVDEIKKLIAQFSCTLRDESFEPN
jgi:hypothetical protein